MFRCKHFVSRKNRFCKLEPMPGSEFCGEHQPGDVVTKRGRRIPCPFDGSHTIFEVELSTHLRICNSRPKECKYETKGVNLFSEEPIERIPEKFTVDNEKVLALMSIVEPVIEEFLLFNHLQVPISQSSLSRDDIQTVGISSQIDVSTIGDYTLIEVGAGRAKLAHKFVTLNHLNMPSRTFLIDRSKPRAKFDSKIAKLTGHSERINCDLRDVDFLKIPMESPSVVILAKHACGEATCFSLVALQKCLQKFPRICFYLSIAPCCHQVCTYNSFCHNGIFDKYNICDIDFNLMTKMSSWAVCGLTQDTHIGNKRKSEIGYMMKMFIDICRVQYLESLGMNASLKLYCSKDCSPENRVIVARRMFIS